MWDQGKHVLVTGSTGCGKTELARCLDEMRIQRGGHVVVFMGKLRPDDTITNSYRGFTRWKTWKRRPSVSDNRILLWPDVEGKDLKEATTIMRATFSHAISEISKVGLWTVHIDEGLFFSDTRGMNLGAELGLMFSLLRSSKVTMIALAQRPSHLPLSIYANLSHAFVGRASEADDLKRLANIDGPNSRLLQQEIMRNGEHDFTWIKAGKSDPPERVNLAR